MSYKSKLSMFETLRAIQVIKNIFGNEISNKLNLTRVSPPLFTESGSGLIDVGFESHIVRFVLKSEIEASIFFSLAKWKRWSLGKYNFEMYQGLITDASMIRRDEDMDALHSFYVEHLAWEKIIKKEDRHMAFLEDVVRDIYECLKETEREMLKIYPNLTKKLPEEIRFVSSQQLEDEFPDLTSEERESKCTEKYGAVFITQLGKKLNSGRSHGYRAPDNGDWELNGDILLYYEGKVLELSSMGIRVSGESLVKQLAASDALDCLNAPFHKAVANNELPHTIGGSIGYSRLCMYLLDKKHVGEVHPSVWDRKTIDECEQNNIKLL